MSLTTGTIPIGATWPSTGGSAVDLLSKGSTLDTNNLYLDDGSTILMQTAVSVSNKSPVVSANAPNGYTQQRSKVFFKVPLLLDNGEITVNTVSIEIACDPETDSSERDALRAMLSIVGNRPNFDALFGEGSTAS